MKIVFTEKARSSLLEIGIFLKEQKLATSFIREYLNALRQGIHDLLNQFPEAGVPFLLHGHECRRVVVKNYSIVYQYQSNRITILLLYRENLPLL